MKIIPLHHHQCKANNTSSQAASFPPYLHAWTHPVLQCSAPLLSTHVGPLRLSQETGRVCKVILLADSELLMNQVYTFLMK